MSAGANTVQLHSIPVHLPAYVIHCQSLQGHRDKVQPICSPLWLSLLDQITWGKYPLVIEQASLYTVTYRKWSLLYLDSVVPVVKLLKVRSP